jgi:type I restriction enzyme S subunit
MEVLQPKLRFSEFKGDWKTEPIGDYIELLSGIALKTAEISDDSSGTPILRGINITEGYIRHKIEIDKYYLGTTTKLEKYFVKVDDLVLGMDGSKVGKNVALITEKDQNSILIQRVARIRANKKSTIRYIYQQIFSKTFHNYVDIVNTSSGIPHISAQQIKEFKIGFPSLPEQTKIANFLSEIDEKTNLLKENKSLLEEYKKGIMQKIFNRKTRFKDDNGNDFEEWEEKSLGEVTVKKSSNISANKIEENEGKYIIYGASGILKTVDFYLMKEDYISIVKDGAGVGRIFYCQGKTSVLGTLEMISPIKNINTYFIYCLLNNIDFTQFVTGSTIPHIYYKDYSKVICGIPCPEEQTKIANFLSSIDEKIELVNTQIQDTQEYKKGLLQQMFV